MFSMFSISAAVVSIPVKAIQSLATIPEPIISDPLFTVAAPIGISIRFAISSNSYKVQCGLTRPPWLLNLENVPIREFPAIVVLNTSTPRTSAIISSESLSNSGWIKAE